jgi:hypothetical protein
MIRVVPTTRIIQDRGRSAAGTDAARACELSAIVIRGLAGTSHRKGKEDLG